MLSDMKLDEGFFWCSIKLKNILSKFWILGFVFIGSVGCATKNKNKEAASLAAEQQQKKLLPFHDPKNTHELVANAQVEAKDQLNKLEEFESEDEGWKNALKQLEEFANADPAGIEEVLKDPKLDAYKWDLTKQVLQNSPQEGSKEFFSSVGAALFLSSGVVAVRSYLALRESLTPYQKELWQKYNDEQRKFYKIQDEINKEIFIDERSWFTNNKLNPNTANDPRYVKFQQFVNNINVGDSIEDVRRKLEDRFNDLSKKMRFFGALLFVEGDLMNDSTYLDNGRFLSEKDFKKKFLKEKWLQYKLQQPGVRQISYESSMDPNQHVIYKYQHPINGTFLSLEDFQNFVLGNFDPDSPKNNMEKDFIKSAQKDWSQARQEYASFRKRFGVATNQTLQSAHDKLRTLPQESAFASKALFGGSIVGVIAGQVLLAYGAGQIGLSSASSPSQEAIKNMYDIFSKYERKLWELRAIVNKEG